MIEWPPAGQAGIRLESAHRGMQCQEEYCSQRRATAHSGTTAKTTTTTLGSITIDQQLAFLQRANPVYDWQRVVHHSVQLQHMQMQSEGVKASSIWTKRCEVHLSNHFYHRFQPLFVGRSQRSATAIHVQDGHAELPRHVYFNGYGPLARLLEGFGDRRHVLQKQ